MIVLWLEIHGVFNSATSAVTAMWVSLRKLEIHVIPGFHFNNTEINSKVKHQSSFLFSLKVELMLLLAILNRLKSYRCCFLMFAND